MARESAAVVELRRELGRRLAACRKAAGMSQASVAEKVFVDRTRLAHLENGRGQADEEFWRSIDAVLGAGGLLVRADLEFRAAKRVRERQWREAEACRSRGGDGWVAGERASGRPRRGQGRGQFRGGVGGPARRACSGNGSAAGGGVVSELVDAIAAGRPVRADALPLRTRYLPAWAAVTDVGERLTAGGVLSLFAVARPADPFRGPADFAVLVQQRSPHVVNGSGRLAVVPKGFHGPLTDYRADARISATLLRELEEELFGRGDVDSTRDQQRAAVPMHPSRLSEPMRWLLDGQRMRMECTGFGLNLVSGNYEFACLTVVEDEEFWARFGGAVEANWEATGLRVYSTLDREFVSELVLDESWSNEGLFALLPGLRRLGEIGGKRVDLPSIRWTTASGR